MGSVIYGVNTGFGGSANVRTDETKALQASLVRFLNAGIGRSISNDVVKSVMTVRANSLCKGLSGVRPSTVQLLVDMFNSDVIPEVPERGSVSASGDLVPTSYIASAMTGRRDSYVTVNKERMTSDEGLRLSGLQPVVFEMKEALAIVNASSFATALAAHVIFDANIAVVLTQIATALTCECLHGHTQSFHPTIHENMPHDGQIETARNILHLLHGSKMSQSFEAHHETDAPLGFVSKSLTQDRYALRTAPQWLGPVLETTLESVRRVTTELNSVNDNPIIDHNTRNILHGGNFQGTSVTVAMDQLRQSLQLCGKLLFGQMQEMVNSSMSDGLPPNLSGSNINIDFGFKGMDIAIAAYMSELDYLTNPLTNHVLSAELHNQAVNSLALVSARYTRAALEVLQMMLANILIAHAQAIDLRFMQKQAERSLRKIFLHHDHIEPTLLLKLVPRYNFAFLPSETALQAAQHLHLEGDQQLKLVSRIEAEMKTLITSFERGNHVEVVHQQMGQGNRMIMS